MKKLISLFVTTSFLFVLTMSLTFAQQTQKKQIKPQTKTAQKTMVQNRVNWVDKNGDGICDNYGTSAQGANRVGKGFGKKDGTGNPLKPQDGTGYGAQKGGKMGKANAYCNGTGSQGKRGGKGKRGNK